MFNALLRPYTILLREEKYIHSAIRIPEGKIPIEGHCSIQENIEMDVTST
jgi:hypothetical protein